MNKYVKVIPVTAVQFTNDVYQWQVLLKKFSGASIAATKTGELVFRVCTREGEKDASFGDWLVEFPSGSVSIIPDEAFKNDFGIVITTEPNGSMFVGTQTTKAANPEFERWLDDAWVERQRRF